MSGDLMSLAVPGVRGLRPYEPGKPLEELAREYGIKEAIKLASNENPLGPGAKALAAIRSKLEDLARYPDGNGFALKTALARKHGMTPAQITLGNGSNEVLEFVARTFVLPEHEVVFSEHAFAVYPQGGGDAGEGLGSRSRCHACRHDGEHTGRVRCQSQ
jgi:histidinol-phosphate aminotransferase